MQIVTSWMEQGRLERELTVIMRQLNRRIGTVEPGLQERIGDKGLGKTRHRHSC